MSSAAEQKKLRELARTRLNLGPRASIKQIIKALDSPQITVANFYKQMKRFQKADEAALERQLIQEEAQKRMERITQSIQKEKEKKDFSTQLKLLKTNIKKDTPEFSIKFNSNKELIKILLEASKSKLMIKLPNTFYTLNSKTVKRLTSALEGENGQYVINNAKSDAEFIEYFTEELGANNIIQFSKVKEHTGRKLNQGGFFPYTHDIPIDLTDFQIYPQFTSQPDNCFIHALKISGLIPEKINDVILMCYGRDIPQKKLREIAEKFDLYITIKRHTESGVEIVKYGNKTYPHLSLGLISNHYFIIKEVPITLYAVQHYQELKDLDRWTDFYMEKKRSTQRYMNSYDLIKVMLENQLFKPLERTSEVLNSLYYDQVLDLTNLTEVNDTNSKLNKFNPKQDDDFINVFFDFETDTTQEIHKPYLCHATLINQTFYGEECGKQMLYALSKLGKNIRLIAHNAGYDIRFIMNYLVGFNMIDRGKFLLRGNGLFFYAKGKSIKIQIQDSYALISSPLRDFGKMFKLDSEKEMMPYSLYSTSNIKKKFVPLTECLSHCDDKDLYLKNCKRWNCLKDDHVDIIEYSAKYCVIDCVVLEKGYNTFKSWIKQVCGLNIDNYISTASLANDYMLKEGVYDDTYMLNGSAREFIQKCMVGGRTMISENKKKHIMKSVDDFDAVSLYPSAMERLGLIGGYLKGRPKILTRFNYDYLKQQDGYFVEIVITKVGKHFKFPLMSQKGETRNFTNDMIGQVMYVDKISLEDLIQFHQIEFDIKKGYYYNEGRNPKILEVIRHLFNTRKIEKKNKNPIEQVFKLLMNASYGKTLLKPFDSETKYIHDLDTHVSKYYSFIKSIVQISNGNYKVEHYKSIGDHYNNVFVGVEVLSMSKRIMNEVMCLAEDLNLNMYYQDTDSIHIDTESVSVLADAFQQKYNRQLIGSEMGQFHTDFSSDVCKGNLKSIESIYLGKKCYIDKLQGDGPEIDYHIRMKGVSTQAIKFYATKNNLTVFDLYQQLYNGKKLTFDLACEGTKCCFNFNSNLTISSLYKFERDIKF